MVGSSKRKAVAKKMRTGMKASQNEIREKVQSNPFEMRKNKSPHAAVIGRNVKGNNRNILLSNEKAITQRQHAVSEDYEKSTKKNVFKDRRFGAAETLQSMTEEQRMFKKMEIQRKKQLKRQKFALGDDNEELLTHNGKSLEIEDDFKKLHEEIDNEDDGDEVDPELFMRTSFRKDESNPDRPRTQKEIMMEIIEKSKAYREQRRAEAEAVEAEIENVDAMMDDLHSLLSFRKDDKKGAETEQSAHDQDYDRLAAQMVEAAKGKASDRKKTQEELDKEEREKLEKLEKEREERMHGISSSNGRDTGDIQDESVIKRKSYEDEVLDGIEEEVLPEADEEKKQRDMDEDYELLFGDDDAPAPPKKETKKEIIKTIQKEKQERSEMIKNAKSEIPYVIPLPRSTAELCDLLNEYVDKDDSVHLILSRIVKSNNPNVNKGAKSDFINFYRNVAGLVDLYHTQGCLTEYVMDCVQGCLMAMQPYMEANVAVIWTDLLTRVQNRMFNTTNFPQVSDVLLLQLVLNLFSSTDFRHNFVNSAVLLLGRALLECRISTVRDVVVAEMILAILADYASVSGRFVPEIHSMLPSLCQLVFNNLNSQLSAKDGIQFVESSKSDDPIAFTELSDASIESIPRSKIQSSLLYILDSLVEANNSNPAAIAYFQSITETLLAFTKKNSSSIAVRAQELVDKIMNTLTDSLNHRKHIPLQAQVLKPVYVSFAPSYEQNFTPGKMLHPNKEHVRQRELMKQVKRERRGVEREMRREAEVISNMRDEEKREIDEAQNRKLKEVMGWLEEDQANFNKAIKKGVVTGGGSKIQSNLK